MLGEAYLGIGSNLGDRAENIARGLSMLRADVSTMTVSSLYETSPQGFSIQPPFINAVCRVWTRLDPFQLMARLREIEKALDRRRVFVNAPRTLDFDILLYGRSVFSTPLLEVPHPRMALRSFVLVPLSEIAPGVVHPVLKETIARLTQCLEDTSEVMKRFPPPF